MSLLRHRWSAGADVPGKDHVADAGGWDPCFTQGKEYGCQPENFLCKWNPTSWPHDTSVYSRFSERLTQFPIDSFCPGP